ncbi:MAG: D-alanine--D-alanine ligase, partial [Verrucomicrobia bacterium]|nr:D-alanine--D-alanine ligase [Cytophagales bacterium]
AMMADEVFIALHGRPGEDGAIQVDLEKVGLPYNGSGIESSKITINKYETNELLRKNGILVANHALVYKSDWEENQEYFLQVIENQFHYPFIAKPADDGCSSAVKKIKHRQELTAFCEMIFRQNETFIERAAETLHLQINEEFPQKNYFLLEDLIEKGNSKHFLEVTGGLLTKFDAQGNIVYEMFEPSEALASGEILSLEEKFLAGEGQNITPARYAKDTDNQQIISEKVKVVLEKVARLLNMQGYCRIDAFVRIFDENQVEVIIIEVNSLPGMTPATCIFHQAALNGYKPYHFIDKILEFGKVRQENTKNQDK